MATGAVKSIIVSGRLAAFGRQFIFFRNDRVILSSTNVGFGAILATVKCSRSSSRAFGPSSPAQGAVSNWIQTISTGHLGRASRKDCPYCLFKMRLSKTTTIPLSVRARIRRPTP